MQYRELSFHDLYNLQGGQAGYGARLIFIFHRFQYALAFKFCLQGFLILHSILWGDMQTICAHMIIWTGGLYQINYTK